MISANSTSAVAGKITGLTAAPDPASVQQPVTFVVQGTGTCNLVLTYADGTGVKATVPLPYQPPSHAYASVATFNASVKPAPGAACSGQGAVSVVVHAAGTGGGGAGGRQTQQQSGSAVNALQPTGETHVGGGASGVLECLLYGCSPILNQLVPLVSNITPGGGAIVEGTGFGDTVGPTSALVLALVDWRGNPLTVPLTSLTWADDTVSGVIPGDISGVPDENAQLFVVTGAGAQSNSVDVYFIAAHDVQVLPQDAACANCSHNGSDNGCTGQPNDSVGTECNLVSKIVGLGIYTTGGAPVSVWGAHDAALTDSAGDQGADYFYATLRNGWVFDSYNCTPTGGSGDWASVFDSSFPSGRSQMALEVDWGIDWCSDVYYECGITIKGAVGVPWQ